MSRPTAQLLGCAQPLAQEYDVALLDLDGVAYLGNEPVAHAPEALAAARDAGMRLAFVTNNASRTPQIVAEHLSRIGIPAQPDDVVTSSMAVARILTETVPAGATVLVIGGEGLISEVAGAGFRVVHRADEDPVALAQGLSLRTTWTDIGEATLAAGRGLPWITANLDLTLPTPTGRIPGNGALVRIISTVTGREPVVAGKPEPPLHAESVRRSGAEHPLVVGDRLDTDIEGAVRGGADSLLVFTGVTDPAEVLDAAPVRRPSYLSRDLRGLTEPHPAVDLTEGGARCGDWVARVSGQTITVEPAASADASEGADGLDPYRAAVAAAWARQDSGAEGPAHVRSAASVLSELGLT